jgi:hypothetical protein
MVGPGEVPPHSDSNYLQCQTTLTASMGAKGIFARCKTLKAFSALLNQDNAMRSGPTLTA